MIHYRFISETMDNKVVNKIRYDLMK